MWEEVIKLFNSCKLSKFSKINLSADNSPLSLFNSKDIFL